MFSKVSGLDSDCWWERVLISGNWSPALQIRTILLSIQALLGAPNPVSITCSVCALSRCG
jgi:ubiquitin-protein ligase